MTGKRLKNPQQSLKRFFKILANRSYEWPGAPCTVIAEITEAVEYLEIKWQKQMGCGINHKGIWTWEVLWVEQTGLWKENEEAQDCMDREETFGLWGQEHGRSSCSP